jgi:ATP-binding cassette subfamily B protein
MSSPGPRKKIFDFSQLRRVLQYTSPYKKWFYGSISLSILLAVISPLRPFLIQFTVNTYIGEA